MGTKLPAGMPSKACSTWQAVVLENSPSYQLSSTTPSSKTPRCLKLLSFCWYWCWCLLMLMLIWWWTTPPSISWVLSNPPKVRTKRLIIWSRLQLEENMRKRSSEGALSLKIIVKCLHIERCLRKSLWSASALIIAPSTDIQTESESSDRQSNWAVKAFCKRGKYLMPSVTLDRQ